MDYRKITAIISVSCLPAVEAALKHEATIEVAITRIKGYGDYKNLYDPEWISTQARVEVFAALPDATRIAEAIMGAAHDGLDSDGIVAVLPVETLYRIRDYRSGQDSQEAHLPDPDDP
ncbi:MAG: P-II family nitrogen regulator [Sulfuriferula sp.]